MNISVMTLQLYSQRFMSPSVAKDSRFGRLYHLFPPTLALEMEGRKYQASRIITMLCLHLLVHRWSSSLFGPMRDYRR